MSVTVLFTAFFGHITFSINQVAGYAVGGGHILHMVCDLTIAADNAIFGQTGPKVVLPSSVSLIICRLRV